MYKPNKQLRVILTTCVKPNHLQGVIERLIEEVFVYPNGDNLFCIKSDESVTGKYINIEVDKSNFDEVLECGKWYPREKFDKNPCNHILLEFDSDGYASSSTRAPWNTDLYSNTVKFMYVEKP